jgi:hypothetical protein
MLVNGELKSAQYEMFTTAGRPAAGIKGRKIYDTDLEIVLVDDGSEWKIQSQPVALDTINVVSSFIGETKMMHTFNGAIPIPRGWMKLVGGADVSEAKYDLIHGDGAWVEDNVASSPLVGKYLPDMTGKYPTGATLTSQDGDTQISSIGNAGNTIDTTVDLTHNHMTYEEGEQNVTGGDYVWNSSGTKIQLPAPTYTTFGAGETDKTKRYFQTVFVNYLTPPAIATSGCGDFYTANESITSGNAETDITPESHEFIFIMRVV